MFHTLRSHQCSAQGYSLVIYRQLDYGSEKLISLSKAITVLFQRTIPTPSTSHTSITFLPEAVMVLGLLLVTCSLCSWTDHPDCLICPGCFSFPLQREIQAMLCLQASRQLSGFAWTPSLPILWRRCVKRCFGLPVSNKWVHPRRSDLRQPVCKFTTQLPGRKTFPRRCWEDWQPERRQMSVNPLSHSVWLLP